MMKKGIFKEVVLMNAFLCLCVVMIHLTSTPLGVLEAGRFMHMIIFVINKLLCFSVPAFIFLSGFKLYSAYRDKNIDLKRFYWGRIKKIVAPYIISVIIYFLYFFNKQWVNLNDFPEYLFLGTLVAHFYYIIIAVQFYLLFPLLKKIFARFPILLTAVALIGTVLCTSVFHFQYSDRFFATYIIYFVLGMLFARYDFMKKKSWYYTVSSLGYAATLVIHLVFSYKSTLGVLTYRYAQTVNLIYVIFSIALLYGVCKWLCEKCRRLFTISDALGAVSYNVYLYHILAMSVLQYDIFALMSLSVMEQFAVSFFVIYSLIFLYSFVDKMVKENKRQGDLYDK